MITLYGFSPSGNCHKVRLLLEQLGRPYRWIETDSSRGATRTPEFLALNPNGKVPLLALDDGRTLAESNAMLCWLAEGTQYMPADAWQRAQALAWMFFEQYSHEPYIAVARNWIAHLKAKDRFADRLPDIWERGHRALAVMERRLAGHDWLTDSGMTIADIALFAYTQVAEEGEFDLSRYPGLRAWLARVRAHPGIRPLPRAGTPDA